MLEELASNTKASTIYVRLLDEGTDVFRPSSAIALGGDVYELLRPESYDPEDECWEFEPGSRVHALPRQGTDGEYLVAASLAE
jgi:hypothetical protein